MRIWRSSSPARGRRSVGMGRALVGTPAERRVRGGRCGTRRSPCRRSSPRARPRPLDLTENSQPAILAISIALFRAWVPAAAAAGLPAPAYFAGHSMGQYSAMVAAGVLDLGDALRLVRARGRLMQGSSPDGAMAAIIGLDDARHPGAGGHRRGRRRVHGRQSQLSRPDRGQRRRPRPSQAAADAAKGTRRQAGHRAAGERRGALAAHGGRRGRHARRARRRSPSATRSAPLLANADARPLTTGEACRAELIEHLTRGVDWVRAVRTMRDDGVDTFVEVGPGKVLTNLIRRIAPEARTLASDDPAAPSGVADPTSLLDQPTAHGVARMRKARLQPPSGRHRPGHREPRGRRHPDRVGQPDRGHSRACARSPTGTPRTSSATRPARSTTSTPTPGWTSRPSGARTRTWCSGWPRPSRRPRTRASSSMPRTRTRSASTSAPAWVGRDSWPMPSRP